MNSLATPTNDSAERFEVDSLGYLCKITPSATGEGVHLKFYDCKGIPGFNTPRPLSDDVHAFRVRIGVNDFQTPITSTRIATPMAPLRGGQQPIVVDDLPTPRNSPPSTPRQVTPIFGETPECSVPRVREKSLPISVSSSESERSDSSWLALRDHSPTQRELSVSLSIKDSFDVEQVNRRSSGHIRSYCSDPFAHHLAQHKWLDENRDVRERLAMEIDNRYPTPDSTSTRSSSPSDIHFEDAATSFYTASLRDNSAFSTSTDNVERIIVRGTQSPGNQIRFPPEEFNRMNFGERPFSPSCLSDCAANSVFSPSPEVESSPLSFLEVQTPRITDTFPQFVQGSSRDYSWFYGDDLSSISDTSESSVDSETPVEMNRPMTRARSRIEAASSKGKYCA